MTSSSKESTKLFKAFKFSVFQPVVSNYLLIKVLTVTLVIFHTFCRECVRNLILRVHTAAIAAAAAGARA